MLCKEISTKLDSDDVDQKKLGIIFAFAAVRNLECCPESYSYILEYFEQKGGLLILKSSNLNEKTFKDIAEYIV